MEAGSTGRSLFVGVDLGGTKTLAVLADAQYEVIGQDTAPTAADKSPDDVVDTIVELARTLVRQAGHQPAQLAGLGIAFAGLYDVHRDVVDTAPNLPGWEGYPLRRALAERLGVPAFLGNDVSLAALAEHRLGAGRGVRDMLFVAVGTGIGGGLVLGGKLYQGKSGVAGEIGHMALEPDGPVCNCGRRGCLEALASGTALPRLAKRRLECGQASLLTRLCGGRTETMTGEMVFEAARQGDELAGAVIAGAARSLGSGLANLLNLLNPDMIVIGGGVASEWTAYIVPAIEHMERTAFPHVVRDASVVPSQLGGLASALGAVALAQEEGAS